MGFCIDSIETEIGKDRINLKNVLSNKYGKDRSNKVLEKTGFKFVHREKKRDFKELAFIVSKRVIKKSKIKPEILIFITQDSNNNIPSFAEKLASELNLNSDTFVTTLSMSCSGYPYALFIINSLFNSTKYKSAIIVTSETYSKYINKNDQSTNLIFSDGASASLILKKNNENLISYDFGHDGNNYDKISLNNILIESDLLKKPTLKMKGNDVFQFTINKIPKSIKKITKSVGLENANLFFLHQASKIVINNIIDKLNIDEKRVPNYFNLTGNLVSSSIPFLISYYQRNNEIKKKSIVCLSGFGVGLSWGSLLFKWQ